MVKGGNDYFVFRKSTGEIVAPGLARAQARNLARTNPDYQTSEYGFVGRYRNNNGRHSIRIRKPTMVKIRRALGSVWLRTRHIVITAKAFWCIPVGTAGRYKPQWAEKSEQFEPESEEESEQQYERSEDATWLAGSRILKSEANIALEISTGVASFVDRVIGYLNCPDVKDSDVLIIDMAEANRSESDRKGGR